VAEDCLKTPVAQLLCALLLLGGMPMASASDYAPTCGDVVFADGFGDEAAAGCPFPVWTPAIPVVPPSTTGITYYVDGSNGNDAHDGRSLANAFKSVGAAVAVVAAGDTVLIRGGLYREPLILYTSGAPGAPITFGSYGDGEVILDGSAKITGWTRYSGNVWRAPIGFTPVAIVVNEVPLKQVVQAENAQGAPIEGLAGVTPGSGKWYYDAANHLIYADMQSTLGAGEPATADIVVPNDIGDQQHVYFYDADYLIFDGLTVRGSGSNGIWGYGGHVTVIHCNIKYNGKAAVAFQLAGAADNAVLLSHAFHNVINNWPRGNNDFAQSGGGWAATLSWYANLRPLARGNIVHMNGGEGMDSTGTEAGAVAGYALFEQNVVYDNWGVDVYLDNQAYGVARNNFVFNHPPNFADYLYYTPDSYPWNELPKYSVCVMLGDEEIASDATNDYANLDHSQVYNNLIAGCRVGIREYAEGEQHSIRYHGLKNTLIANNTIILPSASFGGSDVAGIYLTDNTTPSGINRNTNSFIVNNIVYGFGSAPLIWSQLAQPITGITLDRNVYYSAYAQPFWFGGDTQQHLNLAGWKSAVANDGGSTFADPLLRGPTQFQATGTQQYDFAGAALQAGSPALGFGISQAATFTNNFLLQTRPTWNAGAY
jgi:hypothetical protein